MNIPHNTFYRSKFGALYNGDCLEVMPSIPSGSVDLVLADPPFFLPAQHYAARRKWPRSLSDLSILEHYFRTVMAEIRRVLRSPGMALIFCDSQSYPVFYTQAYAHFPNLMAIVWDKGRIGMGQPWRNQHELILSCADAGIEFSTTQGTVVKCSPIPSADRIHPAEKPVGLLKRMVGLATKEGGTVLDPFAGSCTTGMACEATGRRWICIERDERYCDLAAQRLASPKQASLIVASGGAM